MYQSSLVKKTRDNTDTIGLTPLIEDQETIDLDPVVEGDDQSPEAGRLHQRHPKTPAEVMRK